MAEEAPGDEPIPLSDTVVDALPDPPAPVQIKVYVWTPAVVGATLVLPLLACVPLQAPLAAHDVALVLDHVNVALPPTAILDGVATNETVGTAGGVPATVILVVAETAELLTDVAVILTARSAPGRMVGAV
jgi:hypothetical protein